MSMSETFENIVDSDFTDKKIVKTWLSEIRSLDVYNVRKKDCNIREKILY